MPADYFTVDSPAQAYGDRRRSSAGTQGIGYEEHDRPTNRRDPKEEHAARIKSDRQFYMPIFRIVRTLEIRNGRYKSLVFDVQHLD